LFPSINPQDSYKEEIFPRFVSRILVDPPPFSMDPEFFLPKSPDWSIFWSKCQTISFLQGYLDASLFGRDTGLWHYESSR
jgi:hypothetical protein